MQAALAEHLRRVMRGKLASTTVTGVTGVTGVTAPFIEPKYRLVTRVTPATPVTYQDQRQQPLIDPDLNGLDADTFDHEAQAAISEYDDVAPRVWAEALARLDPAHPPHDVPLKRWLRFIDDCGRFFASRWALQAEALGWGPYDLFGCDRHKPFARIDRAGLLWLLDGRELLALSAETVKIATPDGGALTYTRRFQQAGCVLAWELMR